MSIIIPQGSYTLPICLDDPDAMREIVNAMDLWRRMHNSGVQSDTMTAVLNAVDTLLSGGNSPCLDCGDGIDSDGCLTYAPDSAFITYAPIDPHTEPDTIPDGYIDNPFWVWQDFESILPDFIDNWITQGSEYFTGYRTGDIISNIASIPIFANWFNDFAGGFPRIQIDVTGEGFVQLSLLNFPLGGRAIIAVDTEANIPDVLSGIFAGNVYVVELNRDLLASTPETNIDIIEEIELTGDTEHRIYITFIPTVDDSLIPVNFGGGLRFIRTCNGVEPINGADNPDNSIYAAERYIMTTKEEICEAIICASEKIAQRILLSTDADNIRSGIEIDKDTGEITVKNAGNISNAPDIAGTSRYEEINGAAYGVANGFAGMIQEINDWAAGNRTAVQIARLLEQFYQMLPWSEGGTDPYEDAVAYWIATASANHVPFVNVGTLAEKLYCNGVYKDSLYRWILDIEDGNGTDPLETATGLRNFADLITDEQFSLWRDSGARTPRSEYLDYPCHLMDDVTHIVTNFAGNTTVPSYPYNNLSGNRLVRVEAEGIAVGQNGERLDAVYKDNGDGNKIFSPIVMEFRWSTQETYINAPANVTYQEDGKYSWQIVMSGARRWGELRIKPPSDAWIDNLVGEIQFKIRDLGEA